VVKELPLRHIFDEVCRTVDVVATTSLLLPLKFNVQTEVYGYAKFAYRSMQSWAVHFSVGDGPFYCGLVNTGDDDTALIFTSDGQLELLRSCCLVYVDATFLVSPSLFNQLFTVFLQHTDHSLYNKLNTTCEVHHLALHTCLFPRFAVLQFDAAFSSPAFSDPVFLQSLVFQSHVFSPPSCSCTERNSEKC